MRRLALLPLLLLLPACDLPWRTAAPPPEPVVLERAWVRDDLTAVSRPVAVGGRVVLYTADAGQLRLTALDPADGRTAWSVPTTDARVTDGVDLSVQTVGGLVVHMRPAPERRGVVTALDPVTGAQRWTDTLAVGYGHQPEACGEPVEVCGSGTTRDRRVVEVRLRPADGRRRDVPVPDERDDPGRDLGGDVRDAGPRDPELLERRDDTGRRLWAQPVDALFGMPVSSDSGWSFRHDDDVVVGWLGGRRALPEKGELLTLDLAANGTAGVDHATGASRWRAPGTMFQCGGVHGDVGPDDLPYRCRHTGRWTVTVGGGGRDELSADARTTVEGFDPATGEVTWSTPLDSLHGVGVGGQERPLALGDGRLVLTDGAGRHARLDLRDGSLVDVPGDTVGWCRRSGGPLVLRDADGQRDDRGSAASEEPCRADGEPVALPAALDPDRGAVVDDVIAWTTGAGVRAARQVSGPVPTATPSPAPSGDA